VAVSYSRADHAPSAAAAGQGNVARTASVVSTLIPDGSGAVQAGLLAPGGYGNAEVLAHITDRLSANGLKPLSMVGRRLEAAHPFGALAECIDLTAVRAVGDGTAGYPATDDAADERRCRDLLLDWLQTEGAALLVDDAQWLDHATLRVLVGVVERADQRNLTVIAAHRPMTGHPFLAALDEALSRRRPLLRLEPLDPDDIAERVARVRGSAVDAAFAEAVYEHTAGVPTLVDQLAVAWGPDTAGTPPPNVVQAVRMEVDQLPAVARTVLAALSAGADLDDHLLGSVTDATPPQLGEAIETLRSAGLLVPGTDEAIPVVASAVLAMTPVVDRRRFHVMLAGALTTRGAPPTQAAEHLAAAGAQGRDAAETYIAAGEASMADAPELARAWFDRAVAAGARAEEIAAQRAEATALDGDIGLALRMADAAARDLSPPQRERALAVVAALLPARGFWRRSAETYRYLASVRTGEAPTLPLNLPPARDLQRQPRTDAVSPPTTLLSLIGSVVAGAAPGAGSSAAVVTEFRSKLESVSGSGAQAAGSTASLEFEGLKLMARGLVASLDPEAGGVESIFLEAAELLESADTRWLLPDTPHALGATVALALWEPVTAEHLLNRAIERGIGGRTLYFRHRLLLGWVALRSGRWSAAQAALAETSGHQIAPRERLLADAIDAGLARRAGDLARLGEVWRRAESVLLRHVPDLLSLDAIGELTIAASRLGHWDRVSGKARELGDVLRSLGEPPMWLLPLRWTGLQVALASDDHEAALRRATEIEAVTPVRPRLSALAEAARTWVAILQGTVEPAEVTAASRSLRNVGLTWEASRLTGQAAIRSSNPSVTRTLLEQARDLRSALPTTEADQTPAASGLSEREQMVAQYVMDGLTYKEIGAQLYISPKTVEHHVAKIRQKLGATTRAEMLTALRTLDPHANSPTGIQPLAR
jgi:DNA-binding CsgD family transcriptional regulator